MDNTWVSLAHFPLDKDILGILCLVMVHVYCLAGQLVFSCSVECTAPFVSVPDHEEEETKPGLL